MNVPREIAISVLLSAICIAEACSLASAQQPRQPVEPQTVNIPEIPQPTSTFRPAKLTSPVSRDAALSYLHALQEENKRRQATVHKHLANVPIRLDGVTAWRSELTSWIAGQCKTRDGTKAMLEVIGFGDELSIASDLANSLADMYLADASRDELVDLLAIKCPTQISLEWHAIEERVTWDSHIADGFIAFCDAFERSKKKSAKKDIATVVRRGMKPLGVNDRDDVELIKHCRTWYERNREDYEKPQDYAPHLGIFPDQGLFTQKKRNPIEK